MFFDLTGKRALITGSTRGLGLAIARQLAGAGANVVISSIEDALCHQIAAEIATNHQVKTLGIPCDVSMDVQQESLVQQILAQWGGIDILICNAGVNLHSGPSAEATDEQFDRTMAINLRSVFKLCNLVLPHMAQQQEGAVVLMSSLSSLRGNRKLGIYSLTKAALAQMARNFAVEWGPHNIRTNAISPGLIDTELSIPFKANKELFERRMAQTPLRRMGTVEEIAASVHYLVSPAGAFTTGINLVVDGGTLITD